MSDVWVDFEQRHLCSAPLVERVEARGGISRLVRGRPDAERLSRAYHRAKSSGWVTVAASDLLSYRLLDLHPLHVWGPEWSRGVPQVAEEAEAAS